MTYAEIRKAARQCAQYRIRAYGGPGIVRRHTGFMEANDAWGRGLSGKARSVFQRAWHRALKEVVK